MKNQKFKVVYINGYGGENSNKAKVLEKYLPLNVELMPLSIKYGDGLFDSSALDEYFDHNEVNMIIGSSTGSFIGRYYARTHNIEMISLNPVISVQETLNDKLGVNIEFDSKFDRNIVNFSHCVFLNKDDELIPYDKTVDLFKDWAYIKTFSSGGHRMTNFENEVIPEITTCIKENLVYLSI